MREQFAGRSMKSMTLYGQSKTQGHPWHHSSLTHLVHVVNVDLQCGQSFLYGRGVCYM